MRTKNVRRPSFRAHGSSIFSGRPTARDLARYGTQTSDTFGYNTRSESPRRLGGGLDKHEVFAPKGRAGNGVPASQPTQPTATRPLAIQKNGTWYTYGWDLTKNICETYRTDARIDLAYTYTPYGEVSPAHAYDQPLRWSSEYHDTELGLVYYNYRHYNPAMGRWMRYDPLAQYTIKSRYTYSSPIHTWDRLGLFALLQCKRYKWTHPTYKDVRLTSTCTFEILEPSAEYCCKCSKEKQELDNAKTKKSAEIAIDKLINCIKDDKDLKYTARADFIANTGIHSSHTMEGDGYGKDQRLPVGLYRITPGHSDLYGDNTPGITALNRTTAGEPAPLRTHVWIHYAWGNTNAGAETKGCLAFIDRQDLIIQRAMMDQKNCGGVYLLMNEGGDAKPGQVELFMKIAERVTILLPTE